jgi:formylglycine-generating enzyme required for sulfatase activity
VGAVVQRLRWVPPGDFLMGAPDAEEPRWDDEGPLRTVQITAGFWLGDTPVTQALWQAVMGANPSQFKGGERPVEAVSWDDTQGFFARLQAEHGVAARLPTEAQWEFACRGGTQAARWAEDLDAIAWYAGNAGGETHPVKGKAANPFGLYDMLGNVWEWCQDWQAGYAPGPAVDPGGPQAGSDRIYRGGSWADFGRDTRAAMRLWGLPSDRSWNLGFRLLRA